MSRSTSNAAANLSAVHATHDDARDETGAPAPRDAPHPRVTPPPNVDVPPHVGGGAGWEISREHHALRVLGDDIIAVAAGTGAVFRVVLCQDLIGPWPWLHLGRPAGAGHPAPAALGLLRVVGRLWLYHGPPVRRADTGPYDLGPFPLAGQAGAYSDLARTVLAELFGGTWSGPPVGRPVPIDPGPAGGVAELIKLSEWTGRPGRGPGRGGIASTPPPG